MRVKRGQAPQAVPAAPETDWDEDGDETYIYDAEGRLVLAEWTDDGRLVPAAAVRPPETAPGGPPAVPGRQDATGAEMAADDALEICGWRLAPAAGGCQVIDAGKLCGADSRWPIASRYLTNVWICTHHYYALCKVITRARRQQ